jgi:hypothetical protein
MVPAHPQWLPEFFLDRSLGRRQVANSLRAAGLQLRTLAEVYGIPADETVPDIDWLTQAGQQGWVVLMKDERIRYRPAERAALIEHRVQAFCLTSGNLRAATMAQRFLAVRDELIEACSQPGPFLYAVSPTGLRLIDLSSRAPNTAE